MFVTVLINYHECKMEVNSGSAMAIINKDPFCQFFSQWPPKLSNPSCSLKAYNGQNVDFIRSCNVNICYGSFNARLPVIITKGQHKSILGQNWFTQLGINIQGIYDISKEQLRKITDEFAQVFSEELGAYKGSPELFHLDLTVVLIHMKVRNVPFALCPKTDTELECLIAEGVFEPATDMKWATPSTHAQAEWQSENLWRL